MAIWRHFAELCTLAENDSRRCCWSTKAHANRCLRAPGVVVCRRADCRVEHRVTVRGRPPSSKAVGTLGGFRRPAHSRSSNWLWNRGARPQNVFQRHSRRPSVPRRPRPSRSSKMKPQRRSRLLELSSNISRPASAARGNRKTGRKRPPGRSSPVILETPERAVEVGPPGLRNPGSWSEPIRPPHGPAGDVPFLRIHCQQRDMSLPILDRLVAALQLALFDR